MREQYEKAKSGFWDACSANFKIRAEQLLKEMKQAYRQLDYIDATTKLEMQVAERAFEQMK